jgi:hypothetical protein
MTPAERRREFLAKRLALLEPMLAMDNPLTPAWDKYTETSLALDATMSTEASGPLLTTRELAERFHVHPKTILRRRKAGLLTPVASPKAGKRGAALRWPAS